MRARTCYNLQPRRTGAASKPEGTRNKLTIPTGQQICREPVLVLLWLVLNETLCTFVNQTLLFLLHFIYSVQIGRKSQAMSEMKHLSSTSYCSVTGSLFITQRGRFPGEKPGFIHRVRFISQNTRLENTARL